MRTEAFQLCVIPSSAPHPVQTNPQPSGHGNFGDLSPSPLGQVKKTVTPSHIAAHRDLRSFHQQET
ncbi:MAG: hypothetical protein DMG79_22520 [Acidobacteria bacterium]|nr:MAG: hypothetical protein DMG79_22520 [Acidobacteriota bacterium]